MASLTAVAARGGGVMIFGQLLRLVITLAGIAILARFLSPNDYGLVVMVTAIAGIGELVRDFGLSTSALRSPNLTHGQASNLLWINSALGLGLALTFAALSLPISAFYGQPALVTIVLALSPTFLLNGVATQFRVHINRQLRFPALVAVDLIPHLAATGAAIFVAVTWQSYWALVVQLLLASFLSLCLAVALARWRPTFYKRAEPIAALVKFGLHLLGTQFLSYATRNIDSISLGRVWGASPLGIYDRAYQIAVTPVNQLNAPLSKVALPTLRHIEDDDARFLGAIRKAQLVALYLTTTVFGVLAGAAPSVTLLALGPAWSSVATVLAVLAIGGIFRSLTQVTYWIFVSRGLSREQFRFYLLTQPLLCLVIIAGLPWGPIGVATGHTIGFAMFWIASLLWAGRKAKLTVTAMLRDAVRNIFLVAAPVILISYISTQIIENPFFSLTVAVLASLAWLALAMIAIPTMRADAQILKSIVTASLRRGK